MTSQRVDTYGPHVRRSVSARWEIKDRWGPQLTDVRDHVVVRSGETVTLDGLTLRREVALQLGRALVAAAEWSDDAELAERRAS